MAKTIKCGTVFRAKDKIADYKYIYICKCPEEGKDREYLLYNITLDVYTSVEREWIKQREIQILNRVSFYVVLRFRKMLHCWSVERYCDYIKRKYIRHDLDHLLSIARIMKVFPCNGGSEAALQKARRIIENNSEWTCKYLVSKTILEGRILNGTTKI